MCWATVIMPSTGQKAAVPSLSPAVEIWNCSRTDSNCLTATARNFRRSISAICPIQRVLFPGARNVELSQRAYQTTSPERLTEFPKLETGHCWLTRLDGGFFPPGVCHLRLFRKPPFLPCGGIFAPCVKDVALVAPGAVPKTIDGCRLPVQAASHLNHPGTVSLIGHHSELLGPGEIETGEEVIEPGSVVERVQELGADAERDLFG